MKVNRKKEKYKKQCSLFFLLLITVMLFLSWKVRMQICVLTDKPQLAAAST